MVQVEHNVVASVTPSPSIWAILPTQLSQCRMMYDLGGFAFVHGNLLLGGLKDCLPL